MATRSLVIALLAVLAVGAVVSLDLAKPARVAASAQAAASPLDDNSVGALLTLDRAMETLAAHVTPAVVNVTVASKPNAEQARQKACPTCNSFSDRIILLASESQQFSVPAAAAESRWNTAWAAA